MEEINVRVDEVLLIAGCQLIRPSADNQPAILPSHTLLTMVNLDPVTKLMFEIDPHLTWIHVRYYHGQIEGQTTKFFRFPSQHWVPIQNLSNQSLVVREIPRYDRTPIPTTVYPYWKLQGRSSWLRMIHLVSPRTLQ